MQIDLQHQVVLVTGGSRGIGAAIVAALAASGAQVALHYGRQQAAAAALAAQWPGQIHLFQTELRDMDAVAGLVPEVIRRMGRIDALVNNAGIALETGGLQGAAWEAAWTDILRINLMAAARLSEDCLPHFQAQGGGRFIHIASRAAFRGETPDYMAYAASKGGLVAYSRSLARGFGKAGIKSFVIAPGFVQTDMAQPFIDRYGLDYVKDDLALDALTQPTDIAPTVVFLASGLMDHATGTCIDINAGSYVR